MLFERQVNVLARLNALVAADGEWEDAILALIKEDDPVFTPNSAMTYAEFAAAEANFTGYARSAALVFGGAYIDDSNRGVIQAASVQFSQSAATVSNVVTGYAVLNAAGTDVLWAELFDAPKTMNAAGKAITIVPKYVYGRMLPAA